eukprot:COSAG06_NODE_47003_length_342_cov_1.267490_1_plen_20_part_10
MSLARLAHKIQGSILRTLLT